MRTPKLFVISGPSGAGKGTLLNRVLKVNTNLGLTVSATTRSPRPGEIDGTTYYFLSDEAFDQEVENGSFLEWAWVHTKRYGTLKSEVERLADLGKSAVLEIDVQGALNVRDIYPDAVLIFIEPPSLKELERRLVERRTETRDMIDVRMKNAKHEMELASSYNVVITNDDLNRATDELLSIIDSYEMN